jgi:hypothetical protein
VRRQGNGRRHVNNVSTKHGLDAIFIMFGAALFCTLYEARIKEQVPFWLEEKVISVVTIKNV